MRQLATVPRESDCTEDAIATLAASCVGYSGAEMAAVAREAKLLALGRANNDTKPAVTLSDLIQAKEACPPRTSPETIQFYESWSPSGNE